MITSTANKTIKEVVSLKKSGERKKRGLILIDGHREIEMALRAQTEIISLFYCLDFIDQETSLFNEIEAEKRIEVSEPVFRKMCYKENPDGFLAVAEPRKIELQDLELNDSVLVAVLEKVEKPGNLGGIIRTAYAAGADAVIINDAQTDIYNPNVIRASEGYVFKEKIVEASVSDTVVWLKKNMIKSFGAATTGNQYYTDADLGKRAAIIVGSEADGLSDEWLKSADQLVKIPMTPGVDSLNVSVSAAIIIYEAKRQMSAE